MTGDEASEHSVGFPSRNIKEGGWGDWISGGKVKCKQKCGGWQHTGQIEAVGLDESIRIRY